MEGTDASKDFPGEFVSSNPELSVVVTVVGREPALSRCLEALAGQVNAPAFEVIVPYDETIAHVAGLAARFPRVHFLALGALVPTGSKVNPFVEHELFDRRRAAGLAACRGTLVAMLEDRGAPDPNWAEAMFEAYAEAGADVAAIGGGVINVAPGVMARALFVCDYGRYQPPLPQGAVEYVTDINICYRRGALESVRDLWAERYQEAALNWALRDKGLRLVLSNKPLVLHNRESTPLSRTLAERFHWGRVFGQQRARRWSLPKAIVATATSVLAPGLLMFRHSRLMLSKGARPIVVLSTLAAMGVVLTAWVLGEAIGYLAGPWGDQRKSS